MTWEAIKLRPGGRRGGARNLRNDARLLKTLLLAALVPEVESLKGLTAQRLAALNHGTFRSPIPGREAQDVLRKCRDWAGEVGEIKITDDQNPGDLDPGHRRRYRAHPARRRESTTTPATGGARSARCCSANSASPTTANLFTRYEFSWRGTRREVELLYENVREMADERLRGRAGAWTVVLDFPFDEPNRTPADDLARLDRLPRRRHPDPGLAAGVPSATRP